MILLAEIPIRPSFGDSVPVLIAAGIILVAAVVARRSPPVARLLSAGGDLSAAIVPRILALSTFLGGVILLFSGTTPPKTGRIGWLVDVLPLPIIEISSYFVSIFGVALILLARGLQRRLDAAYHLTLYVLAGGALFALTSALDIEQATLLLFMFIALSRSHKFFYRKSSLFEERFTRGWYVAIVGVLVATVALGLLRYGHDIVSTRVFWDYDDLSNAPRAGRALTLAMVCLFALSVARLLSPARKRRVIGHADMGLVRQVVDLAPVANAHLALLGDKEIIFSEGSTAFLMVGSAGASRVVMGDPIGPVPEAAKLIDTFVRDCDQHGTWPVFYRVAPHLLYLYLDYGLAVVKLGEVAKVPLDDFSLEGSSRKNLRRVHKKLVEGGCSFRVLEREEVPALLSRLRVVSDEWLDEKHTREKSFSLGKFDGEYLQQARVGIVSVEDRIIAFVTLWTSGQFAEVEVDLMRHTRDAPPGVMRYALTEALLWGKQQGYAEFNLGMVPLSGIKAGSVAPLWNQMANALRASGEKYYNFQGLREFKAWFHPEWEPSYLVSPGGTRRPMIVANIATLISGGTGGLLGK